MSVVASTSSPYGDVGWTCWRCGSYVPNGCTHHCPSNSIGTPFTPAPAQMSPDPLDRIANALERIAAVLEASNQERSPAKERP